MVISLVPIGTMVWVKQVRLPNAIRVAEERQEELQRRTAEAEQVEQERSIIHLDAAPWFQSSEAVPWLTLLQQAARVEAGRRELVPAQIPDTRGRPGHRQAARFLDAGYAYVRFAVDNPAYFQVMFSGETNKEDPAALAARDRSLGQLFAFVEDAKASGFFCGAATIDVVLPVFAMHQGLSALAASGALGPLGFADLRAASDVAHGSLLDGLGAKPRVAQ